MDTNGVIELLKELHEEPDVTEDDLRKIKEGLDNAPVGSIIFIPMYKVTRYKGGNYLDTRYKGGNYLEKVNIDTWSISRCQYQ